MALCSRRLLNERRTEMHELFLRAIKQARDADLWFWTCTVDICWRTLAVLPHYGVNCLLITMSPVPLLYCVLFRCLNCQPRSIIPSTPPESPFTELLIALSSSTWLCFLSQPLCCSCLDHFFPELSEYLPTVRGAWMVMKEQSDGVSLGALWN